MNRRTVLTKTGKGLMEATGKSSNLSRDLRNILKEIDGKVSVSGLLEKFEKIPQRELGEALRNLVRDGYVREFIGQQDGGPRAATGRPPAPQASEGAGGDLDFTDFTPLKPSSEDERLQAQAREIARQAQATRTREEAAARGGRGARQERGGATRPQGGGRASAPRGSRAHGSHRGRNARQSGSRDARQARIRGAGAPRGGGTVPARVGSQASRRRGGAQAQGRRGKRSLDALPARAGREGAGSRAKRARGEGGGGAQRGGGTRSPRIRGGSPPEGRGKARRGKGETDPRGGKNAGRFRGRGGCTGPQGGAGERTLRRAGGARQARGGPGFRRSGATRAEGLGEKKAGQLRQTTCAVVARAPGRFDRRGSVRALGTRSLRKSGPGVAGRAGEDRRLQLGAAAGAAAEVRKGRDRKRAPDARRHDQGHPADRLRAGRKKDLQAPRAGKRGIPQAISERAAAGQRQRRVARGRASDGQGTEARYPGVESAGARARRELLPERRAEIGHVRRR